MLKRALLLVLASRFCAFSALAQQANKPDYLLHVTTVETGHGYIHQTCISIYPEGFFLVGKSSSLINDKTEPKLKVKSGTLSSESMQVLHKVLDDPQLVKLGQYRTELEQQWAVFTEAEDIYVKITRGPGVQTLHFFTMFGTPSRYKRGNFHPALSNGEGYTVEQEKKFAKPLLEFVKKNVEKAKGLADTNSGVSCEMNLY